MNRYCQILALTLFAGMGALQAQNANPISSNLKQSWENVNGLLTRMADAMPEADYRYKPTPEVQDFGTRMAHVVGANLRTCAQLQGQQKQATFSEAATKAEVAAALKDATETCGALFNSLTDASLTQMVPAGRGERMRIATIQGILLEHSQEMYGYMAVYLRMKGIVPPSSNRNER